MTPVTPKVPYQAGSSIQVISIKPSFMQAKGLMIMPPLAYLPLLMNIRAVLTEPEVTGLSSMVS